MIHTPAPTIEQWAFSRDLYPEDLTRRQVMHYFRHVLHEPEKWLRRALRELRKAEEEGLILDYGLGGYEFHDYISAALTRYANERY